MEWFERQAEALTQNSSVLFTTNHLDEIDIALVDGELDVRNGLDVLILITHLADRRLPDVAVSLALDLGWSARLNVEPPDLEELYAAPDVLHAPPSLYLITPTEYAPPTSRESYRCPYDSTPWGGKLRR
ncbi:hypothetical protein [Microbacterium sp.]|uniref:hypothetical protein n=1 Tax=Microbacterium sp. TaxID=51671 RepID=UPI0035613C1E